MKTTLKKLIGNKNMKDNSKDMLINIYDKNPISNNDGYLIDLITEYTKLQSELIKQNRQILEEYKNYNATLQRLESKIQNCERILLTNFEEKVKP